MAGKNRSGIDWSDPEQVKAYYAKYYLENRERELERVAKWRSENRERHLENCAKWRSENRERRAEYDAKYYLENRERELERAAKWRSENREKILERVAKYYLENRERELERATKWRSENRDRFNELNAKAKHKRRAKKASNGVVPYSIEDFKKRQNRIFSKYCAYCDCVLNESNRTIDHFTPISKGGQDRLFNLIQSCKSCNSSKGSKDFLEWFPRHPNYSLGQAITILKSVKRDDLIPLLPGFRMIA